jgi:hypothetical protein
MKNIHPQSNLSSRSGQSLIEVMVAITMLTVSFLGISSLLAQSLALSRVTANNVTATYLASEGVEIAKNLIDHDFYAQQIANQGNGWGDCYNKLYAIHQGFEIDYSTVDCTPGNTPKQYSSSDYLYYHPDTTQLYDYNESNDVNAVLTGFTREITMTLNGDEITVDSTVWFPGFSGATDNIQLEDTFYKWY